MLSFFSLAPRFKRTAKQVSAQDFLPLVPGGIKFGIDLGCGPTPQNPFGVEVMGGFDLRDFPESGVRACDLTLEEIPLESGSVGLVSAFDFIEHVPRWERFDGAVRFPFVELMSEIHRVLIPGGYFFSRTPAYPSPEAFQDPTHVNFITENTFRRYFSGVNWAEMYGFTGRFELVKQGWEGPHLLSLLRKPKRLSA